MKENCAELPGSTTFWRYDRAANTYVLHRRKLVLKTRAMPAVGYISDMQQIVKASWSVFQRDGMAAFKLSERSLFPPGLSEGTTLEDKLKY